MTVQTDSFAIQRSAQARLNTLHALLAVQSGVVILVSINRLGPWTLGYVLPNEFLRWVDFHNMLLLPLMSLVSFYLVKKQIEATPAPALPSREATRAGRKGGWRLALNLAFLVGVYLLGAGYGAHEVTNYLHARFCPGDSASPLCQIVIFNDDEFSHGVFFAGFVLINGALMLLQAVFRRPETVGRRDLGLLALNGLFIGAGIFANLAFETIGLDLYVVALLALLAVGLLWRRGPQPLLIYYSVAYTAGLIGTGVYKILSG